MPAELHKKLLNPGAWSWTSRRLENESTSEAMDTTWPRSYTCTFCGREFRSAQALGGHMNVHRRDRARLHESSQTSNPSSSTTTSPAMAFQVPLEFVPGGGGSGGGAGLCLFYELPEGRAVLAPAGKAPSTVLSVSLYAGNGLVYDLMPAGSACESCTLDFSGSDAENKGGNGVEELDLELRLGW